MDGPPYRQREMVLVPGEVSGHDRGRRDVELVRVQGMSGQVMHVVGRPELQGRPAVLLRAARAGGVVQHHVSATRGEAAPPQKVAGRQPRLSNSDHDTVQGAVHASSNAMVRGGAAVVDTATPRCRHTESRPPAPVTSARPSSGQSSANPVVCHVQGWGVASGVGIASGTVAIITAPSPPRSPSKGYARECCAGRTPLRGDFESEWSGMRCYLITVPTRQGRCRSE
jgi:hypothetical protein